MAYPIKIIQKKITQEELRSFLGQPFDDMVKFVVDLQKKILALGGEMHADCEEVLLAAGSNSQNLWGANFYPENIPDKRIEYTSLINIRPRANNRDMYIQDENIRAQVKEIAEKLILSPDEQL